MRWLKHFVRNNMHSHTLHSDLMALGAGYDWSCGQFSAIPAYFKQPEVRKALHLPEESQGSVFHYDSSGPASVTLYPYLIQNLDRVLIYNGDADACVPYIGNQEWTTGMHTQGVVTASKAWHPWYLQGDPVPVGSATTYKVPGTKNSFAFVTIRLAGHEVPHYTPPQAEEMFKRFVNGEEW